MQCSAVILAIALLGPVLGMVTPQSREGNHKRKPATGKILAVVLDKNDARVAGAEIFINGNGQEHCLISNEAGEFSIVLPAGVYYLVVEANGFRRFEGGQLHLNADTTEMINIHLDVAVYENPA